MAFFIVPIDTPMAVAASSWDIPFFLINTLIFPILNLLTYLEQV